MSHLGTLGIGLGAGLTIAHFLLSAKAHGRQIRLEREREGHPEVTFGAENHPWVEALWGRDRRILWRSSGVIAPVLIGYLLFAKDLGLPFPAACSWLCSFPASVVLAFFWALSLAFLIAGLASLRRLLRSLGDTPGVPAGTPSDVGTPQHTEETWLRSARRGSIAYWGSVLTLGILILFVLAIY